MDFLWRNNAALDLNCFTVDKMLNLRRLQEMGRDAHVPLFACFVDLQKACDLVHRRIGGLSQNNLEHLAAIRRLHDGMRACVRSEGVKGSQ